MVTHYGRMYGVVPVRLDMTNPDEPLVAVRHWSLEPVLDICEAIYGLLVRLRLLIDSDYEPTYPILVTRAVEDY
jgi:hypothetical protein